jgi:VanZ family protein
MSKKIVFYWLPVILWCCLIFYLSSIPDLRSDFPNNIDYVLRKLAHMTEYAILAFLFFRAAVLDVGKKRALVFAIFFAFIFALSDEYHQTFVAGRSGNAVDILIDSSAILLSAAAIDKRCPDVSIRKSE